MDTQTDKDTILIVDDMADNLQIIGQLLKPYYRVRIARNGRQALEILEEGMLPDLILLDVMMPDMDGYTTCARIRDRAEWQHIPIIFLTALDDTVNEELGLALGASDYLGKPASPPVLQARVQTHLKLKKMADALRSHNASLQEEVVQRTREIIEIQDCAIVAIASLAQAHDNETTNHLIRTQRYVQALAWHLCIHPHFSAILTTDYISMLTKSVPLHDIGKVGIADRILLNPGPYSGEDHRAMQEHTRLGHEALCQAEKILGKPAGFLALAKEIALSHHEKWDGSGYPEGLSGEQIPLSARMMHIADTYDAIISDRVFRPSISHEDALQVMTEGRGTEFDPVLLDAFLDINKAFHQIAVQYRDDEQSLQAKMHDMQNRIGDLP